LTYSNINIEKKRGKVIPKILSFSFYKIIRKEMRNLRVESSFPNDKVKKLVIQGWKKLGNVKCQSTHYVVSDPISTNEMCKSNTSIRNQLLFQT